MKVSISFDRGDFDLQEMATRKPVVKEDEDKKFHTILSNLKFRLDQEMHKLAESRKHLTEEAIKRATAFIKGLKKRYNELYQKRYGQIYYKSVTANSKETRVKLIVGNSLSAAKAEAPSLSDLEAQRDEAVKLVASLNLQIRTLKEKAEADKVSSVLTIAKSLGYKVAKSYDEYMIKSPEVAQSTKTAFGGIACVANLRGVGLALLVVENYIEIRRGVSTKKLVATRNHKVYPLKSVTQNSVKKALDAAEAAAKKLAAKAPKEETVSFRQMHGIKL